MSVATEAPAPTAPPAPAPTVAGEERFLIRNVTWEGYQKLLEVIHNGKPRMYYLEGAVELMTTHLIHEWHKRILAMMIEALTEELDIPRAAVGSTTLTKRTVERGAEPDEGYYLTNIDRLVGQTAGADLDVLPPPDLVIEVEHTNPLLDKLSIYAGMGVPEIWRHAGGRLIVLVLGADGRYAESPASRAFPFLPMDGFRRHLDAYRVDQETRWIKAFRAWVRQDVAPHHPGGPR